MRFDNKVAIVTGAGEGIGKEYALDLTKRGAKVVVNDIGLHPRKGSTADQVVQIIKDSGGQAVGSSDSVTTMAGGRQIVETALKHSGNLDILVCNAGVLRDRTFMKMIEEDTTSASFSPWKIGYLKISD